MALYRGGVKTIGIHSVIEFEFEADETDEAEVQNVALGEARDLTSFEYWYEKIEPDEDEE